MASIRVVAVSKAQVAPDSHEEPMGGNAVTIDRAHAWGETAVGAALAAAGLAVCFFAWRGGLMSQGEPTEWTVPFLAGACMAVCAGAGTAIKLLKTLDPGGRTREPASFETGESVSIVDRRRLAIYVAVLIAFALGMERIGLAILILVLMPFLLHYAEGLSWARSVSLSVATVVVVVGVFQLVLGVQLPLGLAAGLLRI